MSREITAEENAIAQAALTEFAKEWSGVEYVHRGKVVNHQGYRRLVVMVVDKTVFTVGARDGKRHTITGYDAYRIIQELAGNEVAYKPISDKAKMIELGYEEPEPVVEMTEEIKEQAAELADKLKDQLAAIAVAVKKYNEAGKELEKLAEKYDELVNECMDHMYDFDKDVELEEMMFEWNSTDLAGIEDNVKTFKGVFEQPAI